MYTHGPVTGSGSLRVLLPYSSSVKRSLKLTARLSAMAVRKMDLRVKCGISKLALRGTQTKDISPSASYAHLFDHLKCCLLVTKPPRLLIDKLEGT